ncbi:MAG: hypothetical protein HQL50_09175 [Magnetococcales bacterium]|nr:hypothetical protein [Magnetococcales bacterium]
MTEQEAQIRIHDICMALWSDSGRWVKSVTLSPNMVVSLEYEEGEEEAAPHKPESPEAKAAPLPALQTSL